VAAEAEMRLRKLKRGGGSGSEAAPAALSGLVFNFWYSGQILPGLYLTLPNECNLLGGLEKNQMRLPAAPERLKLR
jgi:hypothetical protein